MLFLKAKEEFILYCKEKRKVKKETLKAYTLDLNNFHSFLLSKKIRSINSVEKADILEFMEQIKDLKYLTKRRKMFSIKACFIYHEINSNIDNPFRKLNIVFKSPVIRPNIHKLSDFKELFRIAYFYKDENSHNYSKFEVLRNIAIIELLFATGIRIFEICNLKVEDVNLEQTFISIKGEKTYNRQIKLFNTNVLIALTEYYDLIQNVVSPGGYFFLNKHYRRFSEQSLRFMVYNLLKTSETFIDLSPSDFRKFFATMLLKKSKNVVAVQNILGHGYLSTTQTYAIRNMKEEEKALLLQNPRNLF